MFGVLIARQEEEQRRCQGKGTCRIAIYAPSPSQEVGHRRPGGARPPHEARDLADGTPVTLRDIRPEDESALTALYERLSPQTAYQRFFTVMRRLPPNWAHILANVDYDRRMAIVALGPDGELIGVARYVYDERSHEAEIAIVIEDPWQGRGLGTLLLGELLAYAEGKGIRRFRAYVLADNVRMLKLLRRGTRILERKLESGVLSLLLAPLERPESATMTGAARISRRPAERTDPAIGGCARTGGLRAGNALRGSWNALQHGEGEGERRALAGDGMHVDRPEMVLHDAVAHGKAEPGPGRLGGVERFEQVGKMRRRDAGPGIGHDETEPPRPI